jgi:hypothetical protein
MGICQFVSQDITYHNHSPPELCVSNKDGSCVVWILGSGHILVLWRPLDPPQRSVCICLKEICIPPNIRLKMYATLCDLVVDDCVIGIKSLHKDPIVQTNKPWGEVYIGDFEVNNFPGGLVSLLYSIYDMDQKQSLPTDKELRKCRLWTKS